TPMLLIVGQVPTTERGREGFQEMDYSRTFADVAKWVGEVHSADLIPEYVHRALHVATHGRPGPVVLVVPEDVLEAMSDVADFPAYKPAVASPSRTDMVEVGEILRTAKRPLVIVGGSGWTAEAS